ncbi:MAG: hypothetical protein K5662_05635 [Lachnospiraceae bacterium]|nr:hypothetical protein [Lachnospiraceae bacterium]
MKYIVYCKECAFLDATEYDARNLYICPNCQSVLSVSYIMESDWKNKTDKEKVAIMSSWGISECGIFDNKVYNEAGRIRRNCGIIKVLLAMNGIPIIVCIIKLLFF